MGGGGIQAVLEVGNSVGYCCWVLDAAMRGPGAAVRQY